MENPRNEQQVRDEEILRRVLAGEREAFAEWVRLHQNGLFSKIYRWVQDRELAEEITQEVFLKAYRNLSRFRGESKFSTWLFQIALNRCRDFWRAQGRGPGDLLPLEEFRSPAAGTPASDEAVARRQDAERLRRAMAELPEKYREALMMRFMEDMSCQEIAEATGQGLSNVKMRLVRGLDMLRKRLTVEGFQ